MNLINYRINRNAFKDEPMIWLWPPPVQPQAPRVYFPLYEEKISLLFLTQNKRIVFSATNSKTFPILFNKEGYFFFYPKNNNTHFVALYMNIKIVHPLIKL